MSDRPHTAENAYDDLLDAPATEPTAEACPVGVEGHEWRITIHVGSLNMTSGCEQCDQEVLGYADIDIIEMPTEIVGTIKYAEDHPNLGGWHFDTPCDCNWWFEFTPTHIESWRAQDGEQ